MLLTPVVMMETELLQAGQFGPCMDEFICVSMVIIDNAKNMVLETNADLTHMFSPTITYP